MLLNRKPNGVVRIMNAKNADVTSTTKKDILSFKKLKYNEKETKTKYTNNHKISVALKRLISRWALVNLRMVLGFKDAIYNIIKGRQKVVATIPTTFLYRQFNRFLFRAFPASLPYSILSQTNSNLTYL
ncbi:MAG TPA: hypothetical protein VF500_30630 [Mucilaginibacter sp.]